LIVGGTVRTLSKFSLSFAAATITPYGTGTPFPWYGFNAKDRSRLSCIAVVVELHNTGDPEA